jgi:hypothetical protein
LLRFTFDSHVSAKCWDTQANCKYAYVGSSDMPDSTCISCTTEHAPSSGIPSSFYISISFSNADKSYAMPGDSNMSSTSTIYTSKYSDEPDIFLIMKIKRIF